MVSPPPQRENTQRDPAGSGFASQQTNAVSTRKQFALGCPHESCRSFWRLKSVCAETRTPYVKEKKGKKEKKMGVGRGRPLKSIGNPPREMKEVLREEHGAHNYWNLKLLYSLIKLLGCPLWTIIGVYKPTKL